MGFCFVYFSTQASLTFPWVSIAMVHVVQKFQVYKGEHGLDGEKPSEQEMDAAFGTHNMDDVVKRVLQEGEIANM